MNSQKKPYYLIPLVGILLTLYCAFFSFRFRLNIIVLKDCDFTGNTTLFLKIITITNVIILFLYLYLIIRGEEKGFQYIYNKVFAGIFTVLAIICIISFVLIRNNEEKIAVEFENTISQNLNNVEAIKSLKDDKLDELFEMKNDGFYDVKMNIANEKSSITPALTRYIEIALPVSGKYSHFFEREYYALFLKFALLETGIGYAISRHIKDEYIEKRTKMNF